MQPVQAAGALRPDIAFLKRQVLIALGWGWAATIVWLSVIPAPPPVGVSFGDKIGHLAAYGTLMLWFCVLYAGNRARLIHGALFVSMGVGLEFVQGWLGYRTFEVLDMVANTLGVVVGWIAILVAKRGAPPP